MLSILVVIIYILNSFIIKYINIISTNINEI